MVSKAVRHAAVECARQELPELFRQLSRVEQILSPHDQKVVAHVEKLEDLAALTRSLCDANSPYRAHLGLLIKDAPQDPAAFDALALLAAAAIDADQPMAEELKRFAADALRRRIRPPVARGAPPTHPARNAVIYGLLREIVDRFGVTPTCNKSSVSRDSACDIVAEAMPNGVRRPKSYNQLEALWLRGERADREAEDDPANPYPPATEA